MDTPKCVWQFSSARTFDFSSCALLEIQAVASSKDIQTTLSLTINHAFSALSGEGLCCCSPSLLPALGVPEPLAIQGCL